MEFSYHQKLYDLLGIAPEPSPEGSRQIASFEAEHGVALPAAVREWCFIQNSYPLLERISGRDDPVRLDEVPRFGDANSAGLTFDWREYLPVMVENQGVYLWGVRWDQGADPPVYVADNDPGSPWVLHAYSYSDWLLALAWDYLIWEQAGGEWRWVEGDEEANAWLRSVEVAGPETFHTGMVRADRYLRGVVRGKRWLIHVYESESTPEW